MEGQDHQCEYPSHIKIDNDIRKHISYYYTVVDTIGKDEEYSQCFSRDGLLIMPNGSEVRGRDGKGLPVPGSGTALSPICQNFTLIDDGISSAEDAASEPVGRSRQAPA